MDGEERQIGLTVEMVYAIYDQITELTTVMTFHPGDIIATGTPSGIGAPRAPSFSLQSGDVVETSMEGLGSPRKAVVAETVP